MNIDLTEAEAIVLADFLYKNSDDESLLRIENKAQRQALWNLESALEYIVPLDPDVPKAEKEVFDEQNVS